MEISYRQPLRLDDEVDATLWPHTLRRRSFTLESRFVRVTSGEQAVVVRVTMVFVEGVHGDRLRAAPLPAVLADQLLRGAPSPGD